MNIDPDSRLTGPIYDEQGQFLGTDNEGLKGDPLFVKRNHFTQGMDHNLAKKLNKGIEFLQDGEAYHNFLQDYQNLPNRPDFDGVVTTPTSKSAEGINRINSAIENGNAITIGVDYKSQQQHNFAPNMNNKKLKQTVILSFIFCFTCTCPLKAQENQLFMEYLSCFTEKHFTDIFVNCDTIGNKPYVPIKSEYLKFIDKNMQDTTITTWIVYKIDNKHYLTLLSQQVESTLSYYYYFVFYDEMGRIINSYKLLVSTDDEYDTKLFMSKKGIKYFLYGPYTEKEKINCKEVTYEIVNYDSFKQVSEQNYEVEKKGLIIW